MRMLPLRRYIYLLIFSAGFTAMPSPGFGQPNVIHIFADDLGYGSVGFNGQTKIQTPAIDALANGGMIFRNAYAASVCSPSRAMLLSGLHNGHTLADRNGNINANAFRAEDLTAGEILQDAGYTTAMIGKHGFGGSSGTSNGGLQSNPVIDDPTALPNNLGYDYFYGYLDHFRAHHYNVDALWETDASAPNGLSLTPTGNTPANPTAVYTHDLVAQKSLDYVEQQAGGNPFYMQVNYTIPHAQVEDIDNAPGGLGQYAGESWTLNQKRYAAMITRMDSSIGMLMEKLADPDGDGNNSDSILENTLVIFTSDNGATQQNSGSSTLAFFDVNGDFRGTKRDLYEGGIHVPAVAYWAGTIAAGSTSDQQTDLADFLPTVAELAGVASPVGIDGVSLAPLFTGSGIHRQRDYLIFEGHEGSGEDPDPRAAVWTIIRGENKLIKYSNGSYDLFDLTSDPNENSPVAISGPNLVLKNGLEAIALAEGVERSDSYAITYRSWQGPNDSDLNSATNWSGSGTPADNWSAVVANSGNTPQRAYVSSDVVALGLEVRGETSRQTVEIQSGKTLHGLNEVRISSGGRIELSGGTLRTNRWVDVLAGGQLKGQGTISGDVYNQGEIAPGRSSDLPSPPLPPSPSPIAPDNLDTGVIHAIDFDFSGIQNDGPLTQTSAQNEHLEITQGFDLGPGLSTSPGSTNAGNEFNVVGFTTSSSLQTAIDAQDYLSFSVEANNGAGIVAEDVTFRLWRNGFNAATKFAIFSSIDGFEVGTELSQFNFNDSGIGSQHTITGLVNASRAVESLEFRLYGWDSNNESGNSHFNLVGFDARIVAAPTLAFDFSGVQDNAPITNTKFNDQNLSVTNGFGYGPGLQSKDSFEGSSSHGTNQGAEFNATGFTSSPQLQAAIDAEDYLSFEVQAVAGLTIEPKSVSFSLWRNGANSAKSYAVFSSLGGFAAGQELTQATYNDQGQGNEHTLEGVFANTSATTGPLEFRVYGWDAGAESGNSHFTAASLRADFSSVAGQTFGPVGTLSLNGNFFHLEGGQLEIELSVIAGEAEWDSLEVLGEVQLAGDLSFALTDSGEGLVSLELGDHFEFLTASGGVSGEFANVSLPSLASDLTWDVLYETNGVSLRVLASADFDKNGVVDDQDLVFWEANFGATGGLGDADGDGDVDGSDFLSWQRQFFQGAPLASQVSVPEPSTLFIGLGALLLAASRMRSIAFGS